jgi:hypothetical protein
MELNQILFNSKAKHVKNAEKIDFLSIELVFFVFDSVEPISFFKFQINKKKVIFPSISELGCFRVIINTVHFQYEYSILSPKDKMTKHESKTIFFTQDFNRFCVCFSNISIFSEIGAK